MTHKRRTTWRQALSLNDFRAQLAHLDALPQLAVLGLIAGLCTGLVMMLFMWILNTTTHLLFATHAENYEQLAPHTRMLAPVMGCLLLALIIRLSKQPWRAQGLGHVIERFTFYQGYLPWQNTLIQFFSALITLASGLSAGREGPAVHLGAGISSYLGQRFQLPNNSIRLLVGCGTAAAIGASFNTPIAGVIFAMEVIMAEYTLVGFTPIIIASVSATAISQWFLGSESLFALTPSKLFTLAELPWVTACGIIIGLFASAFMLIAAQLHRTHHWLLELRFLIAGGLTALAAWLLPDILGTGYDLVQLTSTGELSFFFVLLLAISKLLLTAITMGLGVPIGIIGPLLVIGALLGTLLGQIGGLLTDIPVSHISVYTMIGMAAMMAGSLQAPLAALMALLELTNNSHIILPGMLAVISATLSCRYLVEQPSLFHYISSIKGVSLEYTPLSQLLSRTGVGAAMNRNFAITRNQLTFEAVRLLLAQKTEWLLMVDEYQKPRFLMPTAELANHFYLLEPNANSQVPLEQQVIKLSEVPADQRFSVLEIPLQATLDQALKQITQKQTDALFVVQSNQRIQGVLTRSMIERYYH